ncbi:hypothetical protein GCM10008983_03650 [Lentibacillus halophilus]|uniref:Uncharacterized protein n=1 Tax=Lentibacillus halophilus TaxID=295065 RepID=A0ABN0Z2W7_9BACI
MSGLSGRMSKVTLICVSSWWNITFSLHKAMLTINVEKYRKNIERPNYGGSDSLYRLLPKPRV